MTAVRPVGGHYEVMVDGKWEPVPPNTIRKVVAPDHGAHVCAVEKVDEFNADVIYCVVLSPEG
jgi:hypothetical protein